MNNILFGLAGVLCHVDDILVFGKDVEEHEARLQALLSKLQAAGVTLNKDKCQFYQSSITFLGHVINREGISPDPKKTAAILAMKSPSFITELRRFMGMVNQMSKFSPNIAQISKPLRELLSSKNSWNWTANQEDSIIKLKKEISSPTVLTLYDASAKAKISADASAYGLGAVLLQYQQEKWRPVAFASRSLSETETCYAQIEKEALALTWAAEKFAEYVLGKVIVLETDHKPLVPLLGQKSLDLLPPRILRFRLHLMRFQYTIHHAPGKTLYTADMLSRAPIQEFSEKDISLTPEETEKFVQVVVSSLPANQDRLDDYSKAQTEDRVCSKLIEYCTKGWPTRNELSRELKDYWKYREELTVVSNLLLYHSRIVIPTNLRQHTLEKIHQGHQGIQKCRMRVFASVWWPGVSKAIEDFVQSCPVCEKTVMLPREPLVSSSLPSYP